MDKIVFTALLSNLITLTDPPDEEVDLFAPTDKFDPGPLGFFRLASKLAPAEYAVWSATDAAVMAAEDSASVVLVDGITALEAAEDVAHSALFHSVASSPGLFSALRKAVASRCTSTKADPSCAFRVIDDIDPPSEIQKVFTEAAAISWQKFLDQKGCAP